MNKCSELSSCGWCNKFDMPCQEVCDCHDNDGNIDYKGYLEIGNDGELYITTEDGIEHALAQEIIDKKLSCYYERRPIVKFEIYLSKEG